MFPFGKIVFLQREMFSHVEYKGQVIYMQATLSKFFLVLFNALSSQQTRRPLGLQSLPPVVRAKTWATHLTRTKWSHLATLLPQRCRRLLLTAHHLHQMIQWPRVRSKWRHILYFCIWLTDCSPLNDSSPLLSFLSTVEFLSVKHELYPQTWFCDWTEKNPSKGAQNRSLHIRKQTWAQSHPASWLILLVVGTILAWFKVD